MYDQCVCGKPLERVTAEMWMCALNHFTMGCVICYAPVFTRNGKVTCYTENCSGNQFRDP